MKKLLLTTLVAVSISINAFSQDLNQSDKKAVESFGATFGGASNVQWVAKERFTKASFVQDDRMVEVFYNSDGDFVATTKQIQIDDLPTYAKKTVVKKYGGYTVKEAFTFTADLETNYFISIENDKDSVVLKVKDGSISEYSRAARM